MVVWAVYKPFVQVCDLLNVLFILGWVVGRHEVDGAENVYAAVNPDAVVVSVDYRK